MDSEIICNVDVPSAYVGLRILLIDPDSTSLSNIAAILEEHSFKVTAIEQAIVAPSILREHIKQFDLIMVDANMLEMDYLEFVKSTQLIKDKPIILMSSEVTIEMIKEAPTQGICFIYEKSLISSLKVKDIWKHVRWHDKKANEESQHYNAKQVNLMDNISCPTKMQDLKGKGKENCSATYLDQELDSLMEKDAAKRSKRMRTGPKNVLERMCVQNLTKECLTYRLKKYRSQKRQVADAQPVTSTIFNEEHPSKVFNSSKSSADVNELFQGAYRPQPLEFIC
uniref:Response regulatory domain-containing protein n=1 Tax=Solanum lycopersicum TaxID=4081 RepID=K4D9M8_SOLLC